MKSTEADKFAVNSDKSPLSLPVRVYYQDTDAGGVVYHSTYLDYMERARYEWLRELGFDIHSLVQVHRVVFFFFQAEDGIRDVAVTGVQTCALPILEMYDEAFLEYEAALYHYERCEREDLTASAQNDLGCLYTKVGDVERALECLERSKIGRASCRERVCISVVAVFV